MFEHTGRNTGLPRLVVVQVVDRPRPGAIVILSGHGTDSQWYRNIAAHPEVRVWDRSAPPVPARATRLEGAEADAALRPYARAHPRAWENLSGRYDRMPPARKIRSATGIPAVELQA